MSKKPALRSSRKKLKATKAGHWVVPGVAISNVVARAPDGTLLVEGVHYQVDHGAGIFVPNEPMTFTYDCVVLPKRRRPGFHLIDFGERA